LLALISASPAAVIPILVSLVRSSLPSNTPPVFNCISWLFDKPEASTTPPVTALILV